MKPKRKPSYKYSRPGLPIDKLSEFIRLKLQQHGLKPREAWLTGGFARGKGHTEILSEVDIDIVFMPGRRETGEDYYVLENEYYQGRKIHPLWMIPGDKPRVPLVKLHLRT